MKLPEFFQELNPKNKPLNITPWSVANFETTQSIYYE